MHNSIKKEYTNKIFVYQRENPFPKFDWLLNDSRHHKNINIIIRMKL